MKTRVMCILALVAAALAAPAVAEDIDLKRDLTYERQDGYVDILKDKKLVARYVFKNTPRPYIHPLYAPNGEMVTRNYPMKQDVPGEPTDHPHHRSFWIGFGDVNGIDFWADGDKMGKIVKSTLDFDGLSPGYWGINTTNDWIGPDGKKVMEEERRHSFLSCKYGLLISTVVKFTATSGDVTFGDTKEGFFAIRVAPTMQPKDGKGHILNSEGVKDADCWGKRARWCDYTGEVNGKVCGITIFDGPTNLNHPTYWHVRDYGLFAANPFGGKAFTEDAQNDSTLKLQDGRSLRFHYVVLIHDGQLDKETLDTLATRIAGGGRGTEQPQKPQVPGPLKPGVPKKDGPKPPERVK